MSRKLVILSLLVVFAGAAAYFSVGWRSGYTISRIKVEGNKTIAREDVLTAARLRDSLMIESETEIEMIRDRLLNHPEIKKAFVTKVPPSELKIEIVEKNPAAIINSGRDMFLVDDELELFPYRHSQKVIDLPVISGLRPENTHNPKSRFNREDLRYALFIILNAYKDSKLLYGNISEVNLSDTSKAVVYLSEDSCPVFLPRDVNRSISDEGYRDLLTGKLKVFENYLKQSIDNHLNTQVSYVDLRYSNQIIVNSNQ